MTNSTTRDLQSLELGMQELEAMEAPGWGSFWGAISGAVVTYITIYAAVSGAAIT